jgi:protein-tyrosine-phosphatase
MEKIKILFVCVENSCRSQIAEGLARQFGKDQIEAFSAGSKPSGTVNPQGIQVMQEIGIDISKQASKGFDALPYKQFDHIVTMGCGDACPFFPAKQRLDWQIEDPKGKTIDAFRKTRDEIALLIRQTFNI